MRSRRTVATIIVVYFLALWVEAPPAGAQEPGACKVEITTPKPGDQVGESGKVRGTARIPDGTHLWVLAHMKDLVAEWWPQGGRAAVVEPNGEWVIVTGYGLARDIGEAFEVAAVVVDANTHHRLLNWVNRAKETGDYPPIEFPTPLDECVPVKVVVEKVSH